jgi:hypothetical protein
MQNPTTTNLETLRAAEAAAVRRRIAATDARHDTARALNSVITANAPLRMYSYLQEALNAAIAWEGECWEAERLATAAVAAVWADVMAAD